MSNRVGPALAVATVAAFAAAPLVLDTYWINLLILALVYTVAVCSITVLTGFTGLLSFGQAGFVGLAAYTYGLSTIAGAPLLAAALSGLAVSTLAGLLLALPAARLRGHYLAIGTLGFGVIVAQLLNNMVAVTRGPMGLLGIRSMPMGRPAWFWAVLTLTVALVAGLETLRRRGWLVLVLEAVKHDEAAASSCGIGVFGVKVFAFGASAFLAGVCGVLLAAYIRFLTPDLFDISESFRYLMMAVVGGVGSPIGALVAALLMTALPEGLRRVGETNLRLLVYGGTVLAVLWFLPNGLGGLFGRGRTRRWPEGHAGRSAVPIVQAPTVVRTGAPLLELRGISKRFGGVQALDTIDLVAAAGEIHGIIGPNGAGKSTLIGCIAGLLAVDAGEIVVGGTRVDALPAHRRARIGIGRTFQKIRLAPDWTVFENVAIGLAAARGAGARRSPLRPPLDATALSYAVAAALEETGIGDLADEPVRGLPYGVRHFVEIGRALVAAPDLLLLDEPATGLTDPERRRLGDLVRRIAARGSAVILIEHDLGLIGELCDRVTVIDSGRRIFAGTPAEAERDAAVVKAYLGTVTLAGARTDG
jgi:branched-chain amino acid transport system permease protein